ncbi:NUDIX domain-containing protein [Paenibacillus sp. Marseille-Q4541]|uniref:NUDIX hydrolase n=1 Tax=Paenibacillus sp. Marseille-Q4541 TaxID=2831522 RepID=UPI001BACC2AA|nr:NUDIX domain-containing protein [Paenibacillus sp. Marseille-Q4541]
MKIRSVSLAIIKRNDCILVEEIQYPGIPTTYYRPIGGTIEFGENSTQTLIRELREELNQEVEEPILISVIENIFGVGKEIGHEIDFIYEVRFKDRSQYDREEIDGKEGAAEYKATWKPIQYFLETREQVKLIPDGLLQLLTKQYGTNTRSIKHIKTK